jgi:hypothetical protein
MNPEKSTRDERQNAALWTPWGIQRPAEREAQRASVRRMIRKLAEMRRREIVRSVS